MSAGGCFYTQSTADACTKAMCVDAKLLYGATDATVVMEVNQLNYFEFPRRNEVCLPAHVLSSLGMACFEH